jgi:hypothetical protein
MKLAELEPRWLEKDGRRVGCTFRCPTDLKWWQIIPAEPLDRREQWSLAKAANGDDCNLQAAGPGVVWQFDGGIENASFDTLTLSPSVDGSRGGLWHGWIRNGEATNA